jgi:hypothetical protein
MYLTAQRVRSKAGSEGVNAYLHLHRELAMPQDCTGAPDLDHIAQFVCGYVVAKREVVPPGGNQVLAYLDVAAPDDALGTDLNHVLTELGAKIHAEGKPAQFAEGQVSARFATISDFERDREVRVKDFKVLRSGIEALLPEKDRQPAPATGPFVVHAGYSFDGLRLWLPPVTLSRLAQSPMRRSRVLVPTEVLHEPPAPLDVLRETALALLGLLSAEIEREGGVVIVDPRTATTFATFQR